MKKIIGHTYKEITQSISIFLALLISFWIPQYKFVLSLFIVLWLLTSILQANYKQRFLLNYTNDKFVIFSFQIIFFIIIILGYFISEDKESASDVIVKKLSFIVFPFLFFLSGRQFSKKKYLFLKLFIAGNIIASLICIFYSFYQSIEFVNGKLLLNHFTKNGFKYSYFRYNAFSVFHHPAYFSMYLVFSIASMFHLKKHTSFFNTNKRKFLFYLINALFILIIFLLSSRAGIFSGILLLFWYLFSSIKKRKNIYIKIISAIAIIVGTIVLLKNERIVKTYYIVKTTYEDGKESKNYPARLVLWEASIDLIKENFWLGVGTGDTNNEIYEKTELMKFNGEKLKKMNSHNQFIETFMSSGFMGIIFLIGFFIFGFYLAFKIRSELFVIFLILTVINFMFESMLNTIAGIVFFCFFLNYFIFVLVNIKKKEITS